MSNTPTGKQPDPGDPSIAHIRFQKLLESRGGQKMVRMLDGQIAYLMPNNATVRLPQGHARIPESIVQEIALIKLEMSIWEYDYWLTHQDRGTNYTPPKKRKKKRR